jgi:hypothetical protein
MEKIIKIIENEGPLTGKELREKTGIDELSLWRACYKCDDIVTEVFGRKYLRLDKKIEGYARLSTFNNERISYLYGNRTS